jgi:Domain of unknown function (DUF4136)
MLSRPFVGTKIMIYYLKKAIMKKILLFPALTLILLFTIVGCNVYSKFYSTVDKDTNFKNYKTFAWLSDKADTTNTPYNNEIIRNNMRNYFSKEMSDRALTVDVENPDLLLELVIKNTPHKIRQTYDDRYYYSHRYYYRSRYYSPYRNRYYYVLQPRFTYFPSSNSRIVTEETHMDNAVTLNVVDAKLKKLVWTGTIEADIYDPSVIEQDIHPAITELMERFPLKLAGKAFAFEPN